MIKENFDGNVYTAVSDGELICTIERIGTNTYHAKKTNLLI